MTGDDDLVTVTMPRRAWRLVLQSDPSAQEAYTPEGVALFNAWQPIVSAAVEEAPVRDGWPYDPLGRTQRDKEG